MRKLKVSSSVVIDVCCEHFRIPLLRLKSPCRKGELVWPRQVIIFFAITESQMNYTTAGALFGKDRTTAIHARNKIMDYMDIYDDCKCEIESLREKIRQKAKALHDCFDPEIPLEYNLMQSFGEISSDFTVWNTKAIENKIYAE